MLRKTPLITEETYHVYNRGAAKQPIFTTERDCDRFMSLLYLANSDKSINYRNVWSKYKGRSLTDFFREESRVPALVEVLAYALMPNHFHLVLRQKTDEGVTKFMRKLATGYSMYFNLIHQHSGVLFQGRFKSSHIGTDSYFRYIFSYVHLNPLDIVVPDWKDGAISNPNKARKFLADYRYASYRDYCVGERPERAILSYDAAPDFLKTDNDIEEMLEDYTKGRILHSEALTEDGPR